MRFKTPTTVITLTLSLGLCAAANADEAHGDVWIQSLGGQFTTGIVAEDGTPIESAHRVFGAEFGEQPGDPFLAIEPGFQAFDGSFSPFSQFRVDIDGAVTSWNGSGFSSASETMTLEFGPQSMTSGAGPVEGFTMSMDSEGGFHGHFDIILNGAGSDPATGVYLLPLTIADPTNGIGTSDTFWFVMNNGASEIEHDAAMEWVEANLVPTPAAWALLGLAAVRRRRRSPRAA